MPSGQVVLRIHSHVLWLLLLLQLVEDLMLLWSRVGSIVGCDKLRQLLTFYRLMVILRLRLRGYLLVAAGDSMGTLIISRLHLIRHVVRLRSSRLLLLLLVLHYMFNCVLLYLVLATLFNSVVKLPS